MRTGVIKTIHDYMSENENSFFLTGDLGYCALEEIQNDFPKRFLNVGIAEQNMIGIATGLALSGKKVFVYSIIPFITMRCYEQIRNDICYHNADVTILGVGSGLSYGILSSTHFALEDIAILRPLPNMRIFSPVDEKEACEGLKSYFETTSPLYVRIGKKEEPIINSYSYKFKQDKVVELRPGSDVVMFSTGTITEEVLKAADKLASHGISTQIININSVKPLDRDSIIKSIKNKKLAVSVEEHYIIGGIGSAIAEIIAEENLPTPLIRLGVKDEFMSQSGSQEYLRKLCLIDALSIVEKTISEMPQ